MTVEYRTVRDAAEAWVREMNAIPQGMIEKLMGMNPDDWTEITKPAAGDTVYVYDLPDEVDSLEHCGTIKSYNEESDLYCIELYDGKLVSAEEDDFDVERDDVLPMWGTMWSFGDNVDDWWLEKNGGLQAMSNCGFRIYESEEFGYFFGIDGAGYDFTNRTGNRSIRLAVSSGMTRWPRRNARCSTRAIPSGRSATSGSGVTRTARRSRRWVSVYKIRGKYPGQPWEDIDEFDTRPETLKMLAEYRMAYGPGWRFTIKRWRQNEQI